MIVTSPAAVSGASQGGQAQASSQQSIAEMGKSDFLTLLMAQIKHQDPMNPMENADFTAQMAQFSSLEQLLNINKSMGAMAQASAESTAAQAVSFIGKEVTAQGRTVEINAGFATDISFNLPNSSNKAVIKIEDQYGNVVRTIDLKSISAGEHTIEWNGKDDLGTPLADGQYTYSVSAMGPDGELMEAETYTKGIATGVSFDQGVAYIHVGDLKFELSEILEVREVKQSGSTASGAAQDGVTV